MQFTTLFTVAAIALTASAVPTGGNASPECTTQGTKSTAVCCNPLGGLLGVLGCVISPCGVLPILSGNSYCCDTDAAQGGIININALNCIQI